MSEMIDRVKLALKDTADEWAAGEGSDELVDWRDDFCHTLARAAIEAMREPTEEQTRAGHLAFDLLPFGIAPGPFTIQKIWRAMIDEALTPPGQTSPAPETAP